MFHQQFGSAKTQGFFSLTFSTSFHRAMVPATAANIQAGVQAEPTWPWYLTAIVTVI